MVNSALRPLVSLLWQSAAYGIGLLGQQLVAYLTLPILTRYLNQTEFGQLSVLIAFFAFINVISSAGMPAATFRMYNESKDPKLRADVLGTSQVVFFAYAVMLGFIAWVIADQLSLLLSQGEIPAKLIRMLAIYLMIFTMTNYGHIILRIQVRPLAKSIHSILWAIAEFGLAICFIVFLGSSIGGYWWGRLLGSAIALAGIMWLIRRSIYWRVSLRQLRDLLKYALPMIPATLALWALRLVDRALISGAIGLDAVAVYEVGYKIGLLTALAAFPFIAAWPQFSFSAMHKPEAPTIYRNVLTFLATGCVFFGVMVIIFRRELVTILSTSEYISAIDIIPWIVFSQIAWALYPVLSMGPKIRKNTVVLAWITGIAALSNIGLNLLLIPRIGIKGAAIATFVGYLLLAILTYLVGQRSYPFPLDWVRLGKLFVAAVLTYSLSNHIQYFEISNWLGFGLRLISIAILFPAILILMRFVSWPQILSLKNLVVTLLHNRHQGT